MGRIYVLCVAGHKTKTVKTLSCGFLFYHGLDGFEPIEPLEPLEPFEPFEPFEPLSGP